MKQTPTRVEILTAHYKQKEAEMLKIPASRSHKRSLLFCEMQALQRKIKEERR